MPASSDPNRSYAAAHFALELDGSPNVGLFRSIEGGGVRTDVMSYVTNGGPVYDRWRQLGKPKFEDIKLQVGMAMSEPFYAWIANFFKGVVDRKTGSIVAADFYYKERARRQFTSAMIKELTFPTLDGKDTKAAYMTVGFSVEDIHFQKGTGAKLAPPNGFDSQKLWTACNFRFTLSGFEPYCTRTSKIDSFTVKQNVIEYHMGGQLAPIKTPSAIDFPNIAFYVPEADAFPFMDYFTNKTQLSTKSDKPAGSASKLNGSIVTYDNSGSNLFTLSFTGADIFSVSPDRSDSSTEEIKNVKIELYTESMSFEYAAFEVM
ncbi:MAG TPA: phage tail protein [Kofleriaceae bacterium]|nr:phage tail protein [Kofleriaceae bacterium]